MMINLNLAGIKAFRLRLGSCHFFAHSIHPSKDIDLPSFPLSSQLWTALPLPCHHHVVIAAGRGSFERERSEAQWQWDCGDSDWSTDW
jgi:hypothetical protein